MKVQLLFDSIDHMNGLARYTQSICQQLNAAKVDCELVEPNQPFLVNAADRILLPMGFDVNKLVTTNPVAEKIEKGYVYHLIDQQMATLLEFMPDMHPTVVSVHDYREKKEPIQSTSHPSLDTWFNRRAVDGLKRADALICDTNYTKRIVFESLDYQDDRIFVIPPGVDHENFYSRKINMDFIERYGLDDQTRYVLFVVSENSRKNLPHLMGAFSNLLASIPTLKLILIGSTDNTPQEKQIEDEVKKLNLSEDVIYIDHVSDGDIANFYNLAEVFVFTSIPFGNSYSPLEAMACGTPIVCSNDAQVSELVGEAAIVVNPLNADAIAGGLYRVLADSDQEKDLRSRGLKHAKQFTWERSARETIKVYEYVLGRKIGKSQ